jgi:hypothetical protein
MIDRATGEAYCFGCRSYFGLPRSQRPGVRAGDSQPAPLGWLKGVLLVVGVVTVLALLAASLMAVALVVWIGGAMFDTVKQENYDDLKQMLTIFVPCAVVAATGFLVLRKAAKRR